MASISLHKGGGGGGECAVMTTRGLLFKKQEVGWRFKTFLIFRFGTVTCQGPLQFPHHSITDFHFTTSQHQIHEDPAAVCWPACKAPKEAPIKNNNSSWCQANRFQGAHWFLWSCWCIFFLMFHKCITVPGILSAHVSIKQKAFAAVSQYLCSTVGSTEHPRILWFHLWLTQAGTVSSILR